MKKILAILVVIMTAFNAGAVLKENNMQQTLSVLCEELSETHQEQKERAQRFEQRNGQFQRSIGKDLELCNNIELMLYSQKEQNVFDLAYACGQATQLYTRVSRTRSFKQFEQQMDEQIAQYQNLVTALNNIPDSQLKTPQMRLTRDSCVNLAKVIAQDIVRARETMKDNHEKRQWVAKKAKKLNDYAMEMYEQIRQNVFVNGGQSYFQILKRFGYNWKSSKEDIAEKYSRSRKARSEWRGPLIGFLFIFLAVYVVGALLLSWLILRYLIPRRFISLKFRKKRSCIVICVAAAVFALATFIISNVTSQNFMTMATRLLSEYAWLIAAITLSIIIRQRADVVKSGIKLYVPVLLMGFVVFFFRIVFMPSSVVNLVFPALLLVFTIWQLIANRRHHAVVPRSDVFYSWVSFIVMAVSCVMAWMGYTLMSVQVLIWWIMQLTLIQTITVIYDLMHSYENKYIPSDADVRRTWFYDAVYKMIIPIAATLSVALSIYWAARVFDLTQWCERIFRYKFVDQPGLIVLSLDRILACVAFAFVFHYIIYLFIQGYQLWKQNRAESRAISRFERENDVDGEIDIQTVVEEDPNARAKVKAESKAVTLSMNIIKYIGWGIYVYIVLVTLHVNRTGITFILTGLSTGIGFAMKDTLENLFYGLSLMNGRVKIGDVIECDGVRGKVSNINYQSTLVETIDGSVIAFLNSQLFTKNFKNMTRNHGYEMAKITVGVAYGSKIDQVREMIIERISKLDCYDPGKGVQVLFQNFGESSVDLLVVVWVRVASQVADIARIKENIYGVLNENGIEIPFPQADLHIRTAAPTQQQ
ncbi:MAG: mechanosensitive ion channel [Muribaculaceae bacterium]|nr:mechanosensitive ion channel [Muribaculaceae bacterium]